MYVLDNNDVLKNMKTNKGNSVSKLNHESPVLLVFLRHLGCMFCKEALSDLKKIKDKITSLGTKIVLVHMAEYNEASNMFQQYDFSDIEHVSDPDSNYYSIFGLGKGDFKQLFGFKSWLGMGRAAAKGNLPQKVLGDPTQMPGVFLIRNDKIVNSFVYKSVGDYPDYLSLVDNKNVGSSPK